jgi:Flp pilus assembly protein TadD
LAGRVTPDQTLTPDTLKQNYNSSATSQPNDVDSLVPRLVILKWYSIHVNELLIGLVGALVATNQPQAVSNLIQQNVGISVSIPNPNDPAEKELHQLMIEDDTTLAEVDKWIRDNNAFAAQGAGEPAEALNQRIRARLDTVRDKYKDLLQRYPNFARGHLAYGTFLNDINEEVAAGDEFKKAAQLDPKNPAAWNNLANYYGEHGPMTNAFADYTRAIELDPTEPVYYHNFATAVYLFRRDAMSFYGITELQVFDKALALYQKAVQLAPDDFTLATDYAESYYGIRPLRTNDALAAWTNALRTAHSDAEREGIHIHLARVKIAVGRFDEARAHLAAVTNPIYASLRDQLGRNLAERKSAATNPKAAGLAVNPNASPANTVSVFTNVATAPTNRTDISTPVQPQVP